MDLPTINSSLDMPHTDNSTYPLFNFSGIQRTSSSANLQITIKSKGTDQIVKLKKTSSFSGSFKKMTINSSANSKRPVSLSDAIPMIRQLHKEDDNAVPMKWEMIGKLADMIVTSKEPVNCSGIPNELNSFMNQKAKKQLIFLEKNIISTPILQKRPELQTMSSLEQLNTLKAYGANLERGKSQEELMINHLFATISNDALFPKQFLNTLKDQIISEYKKIQQDIGKIFISGGSVPSNMFQDFFSTETYILNTYNEQPDDKKIDIILNLIHQAPTDERALRFLLNQNHQIGKDFYLVICRTKGDCDIIFMRKFIKFSQIVEPNIIVKEATIIYNNHIDLLETGDCFAESRHLINITAARSNQLKTEIESNNVPGIKLAMGNIARDVCNLIAQNFR